MNDYIPVPQPPLTPEQIATGKEVEIRRLTARVHELEHMRDLLESASLNRANEMVALCARVRELEQEALSKDMVPRSRYDAANRDWLNEIEMVGRTRHAAKEEIERLETQLAALKQAHQQAVNERDDFKATKEQVYFMLQTTEAELQQAVEALAALCDEVSSYTTERQYHSRDHASKDLDKRERALLAQLHKAKAALATHKETGEYQR